MYHHMAQVQLCMYVRICLEVTLLSVLNRLTSISSGILTTPVGPYFKGGAKPITIRVTDFDRAAPHGTGHIKAGLNYAMSLHAIVDAHRQGI